MNNSFSNNEANQTGSAIFIDNTNSTSQIFLLNNNFESNCLRETNDLNENFESTGSTIYLFDPGNISIEGNSLLSSIGKLGAAIYYEENNFETYKCTLLNNYFANNKAMHGGGALFWKSNFQNFDPLKNNNIFYNNTALYGKNFATAPFRLSLVKYNNNQKVPSGFKLTAKPGEVFSLSFQIIDYYGNQVTKYAGSANLFSNLNKNFQTLDSSKMVVLLQSKTSEVISGGN